MTAVRSVLFDMDGVLYAYDRTHRLELLEGALDVPAATIKAKVFDGGIEDAHDLGQLSTDDYMAAIADALGVSLRLGQWVAARKWAMAPEPAMLDLAKQLGSRAEIALMTNNGQFMADAIDEVAPELRGIFGAHIYFSGTLGMGKEHTPTFPKLMTMLGWDAASTLFVDNSPVYIAAADAAGVNTHLFEDIDGLRARLNALGIDLNT